jgi:transcriptional repressor NF-X1
MKNGENYPIAMECDSTCALIERNRRLAEALQVQNPDLTDFKGAPKYSETLKDFARKDRPFAQFVHDKLKDLVMKTNEVNVFIKLNLF